MPGSRLVTVLFTDLVDSTRLLADLGDDGDELRRAHFSSLRRAIAEHGGEEVKSTGDGLMVTFERPSDGAACAVELQRQTARLALRHARLTIAIRVGLAVGEATHEDGDWFGTPVVEAARLCAAAGPGGILATDVVRALAGPHSATFVSREPMHLKGLPQPIPVVGIDWEPEVAPVDLPPLLANLPGRQVFVGRSLETDRLGQAWKRSLEGRRQTVLVAGEPGVGKTGLARQLALTAAQAGATILYGRCEEELGLAYQPFAEALQQLVATCPTEVLARHTSVWGGELARLVPSLSHRLSEVTEPVRADPEVERYRLFEAVADLLSNADDGAGVVLILDDLHWADKATLLLLRHLVVSTDPAALLVVALYRETDLDRRHPLAEMLADLRRHDDVERLALGGLDAGGVEAFVEAAAGQPLGEDGAALARAVFEETEGNPFFVGQVLRHLAESGALYERDGRWRFDGEVDQLGIPEGVREVIGRRLNRLTTATNVVLRTASVIGREFELRLVAEATELSEGEVVDALEEAMAARLVVEVPGSPDHFVFVHALVREVLYDELSTSRRVRLHRDVGEALERRPAPSLAALAHHFCEAAAAGEVDRAAQHALQAGREALASLAYEDAATVFGRGIEVLDAARMPDTAVRAELLLGVAEARNATGDLGAASEAAVAAADVARALGDAALLARAGLAAVVGLPPHVDDRAEALLEEAVARLDAGDSPLRARVLAELSAGQSILWTDLPRRDALSAEAVAIARRVGDPIVLAEALARRHAAIWGPANLEERLELAEEMGAFGTGFQLFGRFEQGDIARSLAALDAYVQYGKETRLPAASTWARIWRTAFLLFRGEVVEAEAELMAWLSDHRGVSDDTVGQSFGAQLFDLRRTQGRCEEVEPAMRELLRSHPENVAWRVGLVLLLTELEREDELREVFAELAVDDFAVLRPDVTFILNVALLAEGCAHLADGDRAQPLYDALLPYAGRNIVVGGALVGLGAASRYLGMLATVMERWDDAEAHFIDAVAMNERMEARPWLARSGVDYADMLLRSGRDREGHAEELLRRSRALARRIGMPTLVRRIEALTG